MEIKPVNKKYIFRDFCMIILAIFAVSMFAFVWYEFVEDHNQTGHLLGKGNLGMAIIIYTILFLFVGRHLRAFKVGVDRKSNLVSAQFLTIFMINLFEVLISMAITGQYRFWLILLGKYMLLAIVQSIVLSILVVYMTNIYRKVFPPLKILEIYGEYENNLNYKVNLRRDKYTIQKSVCYKDGLKNIFDLIDEYDAILINDIPSDEKNKIVKKCYEMDKRVYFVPKLSDIIMKSSEELNLFDTPLFLCKNVGLTNTQLFTKRVFDIVLSTISLILFSPVFLVVAIAIKLEDGGPVFFRQERVTINGKRFYIYKFRSMIVDAESDGKPHPVAKGDDRITKVGKRIRALRIDELPQLINIFKGDMSIVGPRPERWEHDKMYSEEIPEFSLRLKVKGGLTGYAQVYGKYNTRALDKLKLDLFYITNYSLILDIKIIFETLKIIFHKDSTEGFVMK